MAKFKLLAGSHHEGGKQYTKGQIVESSHDLHTMFRNKFSPAGGSELTEGPDPDDEPEAPAPKPKASKAPKKAAAAKIDFDS